jgi:hypothetical protein
MQVPRYACAKRTAGASAATRPRARVVHAARRSRQASRPRVATALPMLRRAESGTSARDDWRSTGGFIDSCAPRPHGGGRAFRHKVCSLTPPARRYVSHDTDRNGCLRRRAERSPWCCSATTVRRAAAREPLRGGRRLRPASPPPTPASVSAQEPDRRRPLTPDRFRRRASVVTTACRARAPP